MRSFERLLHVSDPTIGPEIRRGPFAPHPIRTCNLPDSIRARVKCVCQTWVRLKIFLIRIHLVSESFDSTQLTTQNGFTGIYSNQLTTKKDFWKLIQIDSRLKKFQGYFDSNQLMTQKTFQDFDSNQLMTQKTGILIWIKSWHSDSNQLLISLAFFGPSLNFVDLFMGFHSISFTFFGLSLNFVYLFLGIQLSALIRISSWIKQYHEDLSRFNSWLKRISRNWLRVNSWLKWIPRYWFILTNDSKCFSIFRFKSTHDSSKKHLILSRLMIRLWVIPMSGVCLY